MKKLLVLQKKEGETPLECLGRFRNKNKSYKDVKMTYAGRLDPMASGALLVLVGEEVYNKEKYLGLSKEYDFEVLFGAKTDTYDILGKVVASKFPKEVTKDNLQKEIHLHLKNFMGTFLQKYPIYSSRTVNGKPLFEYGREGLKVEAPDREVTVKSLKLLKVKEINKEKLLSNIEARIPKISGDFRQEEILKIWRKKLSKHTQQFYIASFHIKCSSGTYVRGIANSMGDQLSIPALAFSIKRTKIGKWGKI
ncbi:hypothetical protein K2P96_00305 [Patescibacteria group bacterium]|nr:hypothetical protein [Patescibacteria group bacterium]